MKRESLYNCKNTSVHQRRAFNTTARYEHRTKLGPFSLHYLHFHLQLHFRFYFSLSLIDILTSQIPLEQQQEEQSGKSSTRTRNGNTQSGSIAHPDIYSCPTHQAASACTVLRTPEPAPTLLPSDAQPPIFSTATPISLAPDTPHALIFILISLIGKALAL